MFATGKIMNNVRTHEAQIKLFKYKTYCKGSYYLISEILSYLRFNVSMFSPSV